MDYSRYMYEMRGFTPQELGDVQQYFLNAIFEGKYNSAYKMFKHIENSFVNKQDNTKVLSSILLGLYGIENKMAYKNVHKRFQRLEELKLIEEIEGTFDKGAKYFRISKYGFMYLDYNHYLPFKPSLYLEEMKENVVWKSLILQFFDEKQINCIFDQQVLRNEILSYLRSCIRATIDAFGQFNNRLNRFKIKLSEAEISYYFDLLASPSLYKDGLRNKDGEHKDIWGKIHEFEERFPQDAEDTSAVYFPAARFQETLEWNIKYLVFRLLSRKELSDPAVSSTLGQDRKFRDLAKGVKDDFQRGCQNLILT